MEKLVQCPGSCALHVGGPDTVSLVLPVTIKCHQSIDWFWPGPHHIFGDDIFPQGNNPGGDYAVEGGHEKGKADAMKGQIGFRDVSKDHWENAPRPTSFHIAPRNDLVRGWITSHFGKSNGACFEIGCLPGQYLAVFGGLGFELNGIDLLPQVEVDLPSWLEQSGYRVGEFVSADFLAFDPPGPGYDVVCSFGLIEHFEDWAKVLEKQASMVKEGGYLVVSTPNFRGFIQRYLHLLLDKDNYRRHNIGSMQPYLWRQIVEDLDFTIIFCGYFGKFHFWAENGNAGFINRQLVRLLRIIGMALRFMPAGNPHYSPFCGLVAIKGRGDTESHS